MLVFSYCGSLIDVSQADAAILFPPLLAANLTLIRLAIAVAFFCWFLCVLLWGLRRNKASLAAILCGCFGCGDGCCCCQEDAERNKEANQCQIVNWTFLIGAALVGEMKS